MDSTSFKDLKEWNTYKDSMSKIFSKMLYDFLSPDGDHYDFLTEQQFKEIHAMGDGIYDLYNIPKQEWDKSWTLDHILKSSFAHQKKMADRILELISEKSYKLKTRKAKVSDRLVSADR